MECLEKMNSLEDPGVVGRVILKQTLKNWERCVFAGFICLSTEPVWSCCEYSDEPSGYSEHREFLHWLRRLRL
jgi:hypothetical protein